MYKTSMNWQHALVAVAFLAIAGCGGGGGGGSDPVGTPPPAPDPTPDPTPPPTDGIDRGGVAVGPIDGFGSVIVNGVRFDTSDAVFTVNGSAGGQGDLDVGQDVFVRGCIDDDGLIGIAETVIYEDAVKGPIDVGSLVPVNGTFRVLGLPIRVTTTTIFDDSIQPPSLGGLSEGDVVEVSGLPDADGFIRATRIEDSVASLFEVTGFVSNLDTGATTFAIGDLTVDYSSAQLDNFPGGAPVNGDLVEAKGSSFTIEGVFLATRLEKEDGLDDDNLGEDGDDVEIEGYVTGFRSRADFDLLGIRIITDSATVYERGTADQVQLNVRLEAEGDLQADGSVLAEKIQFEPEGRLEAAAVVEAINVNSSTLTVLGIAVITDTGTSFEDQLLDQQTFGLGDLRVGDWVEVRGFEDEQGRFVAQQVERDEAEDEVELRGTAEDVSSPSFSILGVAIVTSPATEFEGASDNPISAQAFFDAAEGTIVEVDGVWDGANLSADQASLED